MSKSLIRLADDLRRAANGVTRAEGRFLFTYKLTGPQWWVLSVLGQRGPHTLAAVARHTDITKGTLTGVVARMKEKNWLCEEENIADGRSRIISLSDEGHRQFAEISQEYDRLLRDLMAPFARGDVRPLRRLLRKSRQRALKR